MGLEPIVKEKVLLIANITVFFQSESNVHPSKHM